MVRKRLKLAVGVKSERLEAEGGRLLPNVSGGVRKWAQISKTRRNGRYSFKKNE
jgi:hypothetical protein